ncbi:hypothetical protein [Vibrio sp. 399]|uniref:hypothetical protein n=1 Tax=Vibrio sp. 399 TaxID=3074605 RepID=UPI002964477C|nr:hypothetical protein [Vibrio sp. 399]
METISTLTYLSMQLVKVLDIRKIKSNGNNYIQAQFRTGTQWGKDELRVLWETAYTRLVKVS